MKKIITGACVLLVTVMFSPAMAQDRPTDRMDRQGDWNNDRMDRKRNPNDQRVGRQDHRPDRRWNPKIQGGDLRIDRKTYHRERQCSVRYAKPRGRHGNQMYSRNNNRHRRHMHSCPHVRHHK